ncbi:hypothetical protein BCR42DRAFT_456790 [Absidia repens]|uniref:Uncharacterized protein n=1 Tax=Absidia repens TaxID=90262 RepID=A0A1X2HZ10_9FUNG|nr:hypothetical protein BCR42DRAFT_456790 [Absidia repens]
MPSRPSLSSGIYSKRPYSNEKPHDQNKRASSLARSSIISNTSSSLYGRPPTPQHGRRSLSRPALDAVDNTPIPANNTTTSTKDEATDWTAHLQEMQGREKQANERASRAELECHELNNKMKDLRSSHHRQVQILVDELERYKSQPRQQHSPTSLDDSAAAAVVDDVELIKQQRDELVEKVDQLTLEHSDQWTEWRERLDTKTQRITHLEQQQADMQQQITALEQQLAMKDLRILDLEQHQQDDHTTTTQQLTKMDDQVKQLTSQLNSKDDQIRTLTTEMHDQTTLVDDLKQQLTFKDDRMSTLTAQVERLHQDNKALMTQQRDGTHDLQQQLETANALVDKKEQVIRELEDQLDDKYKTTAELQQQMHDHETEAAYTASRLDQLTKQLEIAKDEVQRLEQQDDVRSQLDTAQHQLKRDADDMAHLKKQLQLDADDMAHLKKQLESARDENRSLAKQINTQQDELDMQLAKVKQVHRSEVTRLERRIKDFENDQQVQFDSHQAVTTDYTDKIMALEQQVAAVEHQLKTERKTQLDNNQAMAAERMDKIIELEQQVTSSQRAHTLTTRQLDETRQRLAAATAQVEQLQQQQDELDDKAKQQVDPLRAQVTTLKQQMADAKARVYELETTVLEMDEQQRQNEVGIKKRMQDQHRVALATLQQDRDGLAATVTELRDSLARHQRHQATTIDERQTVIQQLERDLQQQQDMVATLRSQQMHVKRDLDSKQQHLDEMTARLADRDQAVSQLQQDRDQRSSTEATKDEKISRLERAMSNVAIEMNNMSRTLSQYDTERTQLQQQMMRTEKDRHALQRQLADMQVDVDRHAVAMQRKQDQLDQWQRDHVKVLEELEDRTNYALELEERAHHMALENERLQGIAATMEKRSLQLDELEQSVQAVNRQLAIALDERQELELRHADLIKVLDKARQSAGSCLRMIDLIETHPFPPLCS